MDIDLQAIRRFLAPELYKRGLQYYRERRVRLEHLDAERVEAFVKGNRYYHVVIRRENGTFDATCDCPHWDTCKHIAATLFEAKAYAEKARSEAPDREAGSAGERLLKALADEKTATANGGRNRWVLVFLIETHADHWSITAMKAYRRLNGGLGRLAGLGDLRSEAAADLVSPSEPYVLAMLDRLNGESRWPFDSVSARSRCSATNALDYGARFGGLFDLLRQSRLLFARNGSVVRPLVFSDRTCRLGARVTRSGEEYELAPAAEFADGWEPLSASVRVLTVDPVWLLREDILIRSAHPCPESLLRYTDQGRHPIRIPAGRIHRFIEAFAANTSCPVTLPDSLSVRTVSAFTEKRLILTETDGRLEMDLRFLYADREVPHRDPSEGMLVPSDGPHAFTRIVRDFPAERTALVRLEADGVKRDRSGRLFLPHARAAHWLLSHMPVLEAEGFVLSGRERLARYRVRTGKPRLHLHLSSGIDWFDLRIDAGFDGARLLAPDLLESVRNGNRIVRLSDGSLGELPDLWLRKLKPLLHFGKTVRDGLRFAPWHALLLDGILAEAVDADMDAAFRGRLNALRGMDVVRRHALPDRFRGTLRPYQRAGYDWMHFLKSGPFGGLLADDMGLGKTVQALAFLEKEIEAGAGAPSLIVCPTSVVFNWENEIRRFTPTLRVVRHAGQERLRDAALLRKTDLVLTSYGVLLRDIALFRGIPFHCVVLDESQKIKNPLTQTARAVRLLKARHRLALTGTPVENRSVELWSQFAFLNPGLLGTLQGFRRQFAAAVDRNDDAETVSLLKRLVHPFMLRRTKEAVAAELPPKTEQVYFCPMDPGQEKLYNRWKDHFRARIMNALETEGFARSRMLVLEGLLRLRQIACHPMLVGDTRHDSEKFEALKELLEDVLAEGHKVIVFSQFVEMLTIMRGTLEAQKVRYAYLDGRTRDRERPVREFQSASGPPVFLISLRAGGVGINLTAADYVVLYDPWWNPAVETQAVDRAHRIGRRNQVFVYKMIAKGTIEEKVLELQERKRRIVSSLIAGDAGGFKSLTQEDIEFLFR